jgi:hypothetical protein
MTFARLRWRRHALEGAPLQSRALHLRPRVLMIATTDYVTRDDDGSYISAHLYRMPVSVSDIGHPSRNETEEAHKEAYGKLVWDPGRDGRTIAAGRDCP